MSHSQQKRARREPAKAPWPAVLGLLIGTLATACAHPDAPRFEPSGSAITPDDFGRGPSAYEQAAGEKIARTAGLGTTAWRDGAALRRPSDTGPDAGCGTGARAARGFLLIHGFTDSPYVLRDLAERLRALDRCAVIRTVALPGHATVPGDLLDVRQEEWIAATGQAVDAMSAGVERVYLVGFSTGAALALHDVASRGPRNIAGLVLLSPLVRVNPPGWAWLARPLSWLKTWDSGTSPGTLFASGAYPDEDPVKYESTPWHSEAEIVALTDRLARVTRAPLRVPVFMAVASRDATVDAPSALRLFCRAAPPGRRKLVWYALASGAAEARGELRGLGADDACLAEVEVRDRAATGAAANIRDFSHLSLPNRPGNPVYGEGGSYRNCVRYYFGDPARYAGCKTRPAEAVVLGENSDPDAALTIQRLTYNPDFGGMLARLGAFLVANP